MSGLYERFNYLNKEIDYLFNTQITEYDMKDAGFSLIKQYKLLPEGVILYLEKMPKENRTKQIGVYRKNRELDRQMKAAFIEARRLFFTANNLEDGDILSIKNDAIFVIRKNCMHQVFGEINFRPKHSYLGYLNLNRYEFYYTDSHTPIEVKGLKGEESAKHQEYMLDFIRDLFGLAIYSDRNRLIKFLTNFINAYRNKNLEAGYYRELNMSSAFAVVGSDGEIMLLDDVEDDSDLYINYNYFNYIIPLANIFI